MNFADNEKTCGSVGAQPQEVRTCFGELDSQTKIDCSTKQGRISSILLQSCAVGKEKAIPVQELVTLAGCGTDRQLRKLIEAERREHVILADGYRGGYFLPSIGKTGDAEIEHFIARRKATARSIFEALEAAENELTRRKIARSRQARFEDANG
mgnify:CR=1 FL=1